MCFTELNFGSPARAEPIQSTQILISVMHLEPDNQAQERGVRLKAAGGEPCKSCQAQAAGMSTHGAGVGGL